MTTSNTSNIAIQQYSNTIKIEFPIENNVKDVCSAFSTKV